MTSWRIYHSEHAWINYAGATEEEALKKYKEKHPDKEVVKIEEQPPTRSL